MPVQIEVTSDLISNSAKWQNILIRNGSGHQSQQCIADVPVQVLPQDINPVCDPYKTAP